MDQAADPGDEEQQDHRNRVYIEACFDGQTAGCDQGIQRDRPGSVLVHVDTGQNREDERGGDRRDCQPMARLANSPAAQRDDQEGGKRKGRDQNIRRIHHHDIGGEIAFQVPPG